MNSNISKTEVQMDYVDWLVEQGKMFFLSDVVTGSAVVNYYILPGALPVHIVSNLNAGAATTFQLIENPTVTVNGTAITPQNHNRASTNTMTAVGYKGCTYTGGTTIKNNQAGFGSNPGQAVSGNNNQPIKYILKPNTPYVLLLTPSVSTTFVTESELYEMALS